MFLSCFIFILGDLELFYLCLYSINCFCVLLIQGRLNELMSQMRMQLQMASGRADSTYQMDLETQAEIKLVSSNNVLYIWGLTIYCDISVCIPQEFPQLLMVEQVNDPVTIPSWHINIESGSVPIFPWSNNSVGDIVSITLVSPFWYPVSGDSGTEVFSHALNHIGFIVPASCLYKPIRTQRVMWSVSMTSQNIYKYPFWLAHPRTSIWSKLLCHTGGSITDQVQRR